MTPYASAGRFWRPTRSIRLGNRAAAHAHPAHFHDTAHSYSHPHREEPS
jgi:hypothetical protein